MCFDIRWTFQSRHHDLLRCVARLPVEKGASLYLLADLRLLHGWTAVDGHVLAGD